MDTPEDQVASLPDVVDSSGPVDQINNISQKETQMKRAGVSRYKYLLVIAEALEAMKMGDVVDEQGNVRREMVPDVRRREWGAEMAAKLCGDMIEHKEITHEVGDRTLERFRSLSVAELRERAQKILDVQGTTVKTARVVQTEIDDE